MKIVYCHNYYRHRGGEDISFESDVQLLRDRGHTVIPFVRDNQSLGNNPLRIAANTIWNRAIRRELATVLEAERPDVLHCNNLFPLISVSVYAAARKLEIPIVQALRNYRSFCANSFLFREGSVCTRCLQSAIPWQSVRYGCYRDSRAASAVVATMQMSHRLLRIQQRYVHAFFTPTEFSRGVHIQGGYDPDSIFVRGNFLSPDYGVGKGDGDYALFVGRLSDEKGIDTVISAWNKSRTKMPLRIVGEGPAETTLRKLADGNPQISFLGQMNSEQVLGEMSAARCLMMPSRWYETFGRTIAEAFSRGTPVIASRLGAMAELVEQGVNGFLFEPGDVNDLATTLEKFEALPIHEETEMRTAARNSFVERFTRDSSYLALLDVYEQVARRAQNPAMLTKVLDARQREIERCEATA